MKIFRKIRGSVAYGAEVARAERRLGLLVQVVALRALVVLLVWLERLVLITKCESERDEQGKGGMETMLNTSGAGQIRSAPTYKIFGIAAQMKCSGTRRA